MRPILLIILIITSFSVKSELWDPIKIYNRTGYTEVGIYVTCGFGFLSTNTSPNKIINQNGNQFEVILSMAPISPVICSPIPPEFIYLVRHYFNLGNLAPGDYTITVKYVENGTPLPPANGVLINTFSQLDFQIAGTAVAIPNFNWFSLVWLILMVIIIVRFVMIKRNIVVNPN